MADGRRTPRLQLSDRVSTGNDANPQDVFAAKVALARIGFLEIDAEAGVNGFVNRELVQGVKDFQKAQELRADGVLDPGGPTEGAINAELRRRPTRPTGGGDFTIGGEGLIFTEEDEKGPVVNRMRPNTEDTRKLKKKVDEKIIDISKDKIRQKLHRPNDLHEGIKKKAGKRPKGVKPATSRPSRPPSGGPKGGIFPRMRNPKNPLDMLDLLDFLN